MLGTVDSDERQLVVADVPGLIEGASEGVGLGHEFLAHLERARLLVHVIDAAAGDPAEAFAAINHELEEYGAGLAERPQVVVLNKLDLLPEPPVFEPDDPRVVARLRALGRDRRGRRALPPLALRALPAGRGAGSARRRACRTSSSTARSPTSGAASASSAPTAASACTAGPARRRSSSRRSREAGAKLGDEVEVEGEVLEFQ